MKKTKPKKVNLSREVKEIENNSQIPTLFKSVNDLAKMKAKERREKMTLSDSNRGISKVYENLYLIRFENSSVLSFFP